jgi:NitT/TauT family transport system substrate-binding protein
MWLVSARDRARCSGATGHPGRRAAAVTAAAAGLLLVAGCQFPGTSSYAGGPTASGTVTVVATPGVADAPLYMAIRGGLFRQAGLTVHVVSGESIRSEVAALRSGRADIAFGDYADMFYAQELKKSSPGLKIVANGYDAAPSTVEVLTLPGSHITSPSDLAGKVIGTPEPQEMGTGKPPGQPCSPCSKPYSLETVATWSVLSSDNVNPHSIAWLPMPASRLITALEKRHVDAILATEPTIYQAQSQLGAVPVLDSFTGATANLPLAGYFTSASYAKNHYAVLDAFRAALLKAQSDGTMAGPVQTALTHYAHMDVRTASLVTLGTYPTSLQSTDLQRLVNLMFNFNALPSSTLLSVSSMIPKG